MKPAIRVENLSKQYRIGTRSRGAYRNLTESITDGASALWRGLTRRARGGDGAGEFWALNGVSFEVQPGEAVGIIGRNGAGKSTLLKVLSRITEPTSGRAVVRGRMGSLLEVGTGFHPELTGRENVYFYGSVLGMHSREIDRKFDEIVAFAEVEKFLDLPVKRYSSGMYVRLAFAVAAHLVPDILVVDEVLAVGDATFQQRCIDRMTALTRQGRTVVFVSHNLQLISRMCTRAVLLERGQLVESSDASTVTQRYMEGLLKDAQVGDLLDKPRSGDGRARFVQATLVDQAGQPIPRYVSGEDLTVRFTVEASEAVENVELAVVLQNLSGLRVLTSWSREDGFGVHLKPGVQTFECQFKQVNLRPGHTILINLWMWSGQEIDGVAPAIVAEVHGRPRHAHLSTSPDQGVVVCECDWRELPDRREAR
jgi:lipopolysaccharide transport system ATP-binding protein